MFSIYKVVDTILYDFLSQNKHGILKHGVLKGIYLLWVFGTTWGKDMPTSISYEKEKQFKP